MKDRKGELTCGGALQLVCVRVFFCMLFVEEAVVALSLAFSSSSSSSSSCSSSFSFFLSHFFIVSVLRSIQNKYKRKHKASLVLSCFVMVMMFALNAMSLRLFVQKR